MCIDKHKIQHKSQTNSSLQLWLWVHNLITFLVQFSRVVEDWQEDLSLMSWYEKWQWDHRRLITRHDHRRFGTQFFLCEILLPM